MRKVTILYGLMLLSAAAQGNSFAEFKKQYQAQQQEFTEQRQKEYATFRKAYLEQYDNFRAALLQDWAIPVQSSTEAEIIYTEDKQTRLILNEAEQTLTIETLIDKKKNLPGSTLIADKLAADMLKQLQLSEQSLSQQLATQLPDIKTQSSTESRTQLVQQITEQTEKIMSTLDSNPELSEQQKSKRHKVLQQETQQRIAKLDNQLQQNKQADLTYKNIHSYQIRLPGNYLKSKISPYIKHYQREAEKSNNELALLLAISHAESSFNPKAKSHIPAFGLMQIVPSSAGMDVATKILKKSQAPSANELYQPETNILYGSSYLSILSQQYLKKITDPLSRKYCTIAAYNTGAGNVARAFNGNNSRSIAKAIKHINSLSSEEVYQTLLNKLPYDETKKYLKKVRKLNDSYQAELTGYRL